MPNSDETVVLPYQVFCISSFPYPTLCMGCLANLPIESLPCTLVKPLATRVLKRKVDRYVGKSALFRSLFHYIHFNSQIKYVEAEYFSIHFSLFCITARLSA